MHIHEALSIFALHKTKIWHEDYVRMIFFNKDTEKKRWGKIADERADKPWNQWQVRRLQLISELSEADLTCLVANTRYSRKQIK